jgi:cytochrome c oxidase assembly protein subunit 15
MPFDARDFPHDGATAQGGRRQRAVGFWLLGVAVMILAMIALGGATRLTGSGLSIMEWAPISGILPPLSDAEWQRLYDLYRTIPQYALLNAGFGLEGFKQIFWLEWGHRVWGRLIGLAFLGGLVWFWWQGSLRGALAWRLLGLGVLLGLQGLVGWFMVASGFQDGAIAVAPVRLVLHLGLAFLLLAGVLWTALDVLAPHAATLPRARRVRRLAQATTLAAALTMLAGGFVAGLRAGFTYNTFPLMDGALVPAGYADLSPWPLNWIANIAAVQFNHRVLATVTLLAALALVLGLRGAGLPGPVRGTVLVLAAGIAAQYALGVLTLLWVVPVALGTLHQLAAALVLCAAVACLHALRGAR